MPALGAVVRVGAEVGADSAALHEARLAGERTNPVRAQVSRLARGAAGPAARRILLQVRANTLAVREAGLAREDTLARLTRVSRLANLATSPAVPGIIE